MKRIVVVTALLLRVVASVAMAAGDAPKKGSLDIWVGAGYSKILESGAPSGSFGALVGVNYFMTPEIAVGVMSGYLITGKQDTSITEGTVTATESATSSTIPITAQATYFIPAKGFRPYVGVGAGAYMMRTKVEISGTGTALDGSTTDTATKFGFNGNVGFDVPAGNSMSIGVDAKIHFVSGAKANEDGTTSMGKLMSILAAVHFK